jgi:hypothetical protein
VLVNEIEADQDPLGVSSVRVTYPADAALPRFRVFLAGEMER